MSKSYIQIFFGEDGSRSSHHSDLEDQWLQVDYDEDIGNQNGKSSILPYPFPNTQCIITSIAFCQPLSMHHLWSTFTKVKKENPQLGLNTDHSSLGKSRIHKCLRICKLYKFYRWFCLRICKRLLIRRTVILTVY